MQQLASELKQKGIDPVKALPGADVDGDDLWNDRIWNQHDGDDLSAHCSLFRSAAWSHHDLRGHQV